MKLLVLCALLPFAAFVEAQTSRFSAGSQFRADGNGYLMASLRKGLRER